MSLGSPITSCRQSAGSAGRAQAGAGQRESRGFGVWLDCERVCFSRLRMTLQELYVGQIVVVRGKNFWPLEAAVVFRACCSPPVWIIIR